MTEAQVNTVALVIQLRMARTCLTNKVRDAVHLFFAFGGEPFKAFGSIDQTRFGLIASKIHKFSQDGTGGRKQVGMIARASLIPISERFPFLAILSRTK